MALVDWLWRRAVIDSEEFCDVSDVFGICDKCSRGVRKSGICDSIVLDAGFGAEKAIDCEISTAIFAVVCGESSGELEPETSLFLVLSSPCLGCRVILDKRFSGACINLVKDISGTDECNERDTDGMKEGPEWCGGADTPTLEVLPLGVLLMSILLLLIAE